ncbi:OmpA family protein [Shimia sp. SDUM112013]|uniref:OmpA family protein n=1 Tax=Shimia sp. SDUM112013 TaxID=3136160 RepID=UPI0032ECAACA
MKRLAVIAVLLWPHVGLGFSPDLPDGAAALADRVVPDHVYDFPIGVWDNGALPVERLQGDAVQRSWRLDAGVMSPAVLMESLRKQVAEDGYEITVDCAAQPCGGFDFRYAIEVMTPPDMFVDLAEYYFLGATRGQGPSREALTILTSRSALSSMLQIIEILPEGQAAPPKGSPTSDPVRPMARPDPAEVVVKPQNDAQGLVPSLLANGHAVLPDLEFATGSAELGAGEFAALMELAAWLGGDPARRVALVGHTDNAGSTETNLSLSEGRARAVMQRLITRHEVGETQLEAHGVGYYAPVTSNATAEGRDQNRRVEVVILSAP